MANRYFVFGGINYSTTSTSNWSTFSNGVGGASLPTSADSIFFDQNSPTCSADSALSIRSADFRGYNKTFNFFTTSYNLQVNGFLYLSPTMSWGSYSNSANLVLGLSGWGTVSSSAATWSGNLVYHYKNNVVFQDDFINMGNLVIASNSTSTTATLGLFKNSIILYGGITCITATTSATIHHGSYGTTEIYLRATQSVSVVMNQYATNRFFNNPIYIQSSSASGVTVSFSGTINYNMSYNYNGTVPAHGLPYPSAGIFYSSGNVNMNNFNYYYSNNSFDANNTINRFPLNLDLRNIFLPQLTVSFNASPIGRRYIGYLAPVKITSTMDIGTLSIVSVGATFGAATLYGAATFSINNLYLDRYLYLGTTNSVYINNIVHTGTANGHSQISAGFFGFNGNPLSYENPTIILPFTYSTTYLDIVRLTVSQSAIYLTSSIILNSVNVYNTTPEVYFIGSASSNNWANVNNWSLTSGGAANANFIPDSGANVIFDTNSGTCSLSITASVYDLNFSGYKNSFNLNNALNVWGNNLIISPSMSFTGSSRLIINSHSASISTNNYTFSVPISFISPYLFYYLWYPNININFNGNLNLKSLTMNGQHNYKSYNSGNSGANLLDESNFNLNNNFFNIENSYSLLYSNIYGTTHSFKDAQFNSDNFSMMGVDVLIDAGSRTFTMSNGVIIDSSSGKTWKYISGTTIGNNFTFKNGGTFSLDLNSSPTSSSLTNRTGLNINNFTATDAEDYNFNLVSPLNITKILNVGNQSTTNRIFGSDLNCGGTIIFENSTSGNSYVEKLVCYGTSSIWRPETLNNIASNVTVKNLTVGTNSILSMSFSGAAITFINSNIQIYGTLSVANSYIFLRNTATSSLSIYGNVDKRLGGFSIALSGTVFLYTPNTLIDNLVFQQERNTTVIPENNLQITNILSNYFWSSNYSISFTGSYGFNTQNFYHDTNGPVIADSKQTIHTPVEATYVFNNGITYSFNGTFSLNGSYVYTNFMSANTASNPAKLFFRHGTKINANYLNVDNIDCSSGLTLRYFRGTSINSPNTIVFNDTDFLKYYTSGMS